MQVDAAASWRVWPVTVTVCQRSWRIPATPALGWLPPLVDGGWLDIVPGMLDDEAKETISSQLLDGRLEYKELAATAQDAVTAAGGRPWWTVSALVKAAAAHWATMGPEITARYRLDEISLAACCDAIYHLTTRRLKKADREALDRKLLTPPRSAVGSSPQMGRGQAQETFRRQLAADVR